MSNDWKRTCRTCGTVKPISDFYADVRGPSGHKSDCKRCCIERSSRWYRARTTEQEMK